MNEWIVNRLRAGRQGNYLSIPDKEGIFLSSPTRPSFYVTEADRSCLGAKRLGSEAHNSSPSSSEVKNMRIYTFSSIYASMARKGVTLLLLGCSYENNGLEFPRMSSFFAKSWKNYTDTLGS
jgi:hypothetical protein